jgi:site-specific recombinase XerC
MPDPVPDHESVTPEEALRPASVEIDEDNLALRRDRAGAALLRSTGARGGELGSLPLQAVDIKEPTTKRWPSLGVRTKNGKSATTYLLQIPELLAVAAEWE